MKQYTKNKASNRKKTNLYCSSIIGSRPSQQDYVLVADQNLPSALLEERGLMGIVCDGMGGLQGGETASFQCATTVFDAYYAGEPMDAPAFYQMILPKADRAVADLKDGSGQLLHCGTTIASAVVKNKMLYWAAVGDSRIYLLREGRLSQLSRDHNHFLTLRQQVEIGEISEVDAILDPQRDALISYMGMGNMELMDIAEEGVPMRARDMILLCSDGLYRALRDDEIEKILNLNRKRTLDLPNLLTSKAFEKNWIVHDNISAVVFTIY